MKRISVTDEWLYQYMPIVDEALIRELEENTDYEYRFSSRFERQMKKLIRREAHPRKSGFYRFSKKAALLFVCVISSLFVIVMSVQAYRITGSREPLSVMNRDMFQRVIMRWDEPFRSNCSA